MHKEKNIFHFLYNYFLISNFFMFSYLAAPRTRWCQETPALRCMWRRGAGPRPGCWPSVTSHARMRAGEWLSGVKGAELRASTQAGEWCTWRRGAGLRPGCWPSVTSLGRMRAGECVGNAKAIIVQYVCTIYIQTTECGNISSFL